MKRLEVVAVEDGVALTSCMQHTESLRPVFNQKTIPPKYYSADTHYDVLAAISQTYTYSCL